MSTNERVDSVHSVSWDLEAGYCAGTLQCTAPAGSPCRLWCSVGCEEYCVNPDEHPQVDQGRCLVVEWMDACGDGAIDLYEGEKTTPHDGPITCRWDGDGYLWSYAEDVTSATQVVPS